MRQWLAWLKDERRYPPYALAAYRRDLWAFLRFLANLKGALPSIDTLRQLERVGEQVHPAAGFRAPRLAPTPLVNGRSLSCE